MTNAEITEGLLSRHGYRVLFDEDRAWVQCLVLRPGLERWRGDGETRADALDGVLRQMFPSHLARAYLAEALTAAAPAAAPEELAEERLSVPTEPVDASAPAQDTPRVEPAAPAASAPTAAAAPAPAPAPAAAPPRALPLPPRAPAPIAADGACELERIAGEIRAGVPALAGLSAERQRITILLAICRARVIEANHPHDRSIELAAAAIAQMLTRLSKLFWPGSVRALQVACAPDDLAGELGASEPVESWRHAVQIASARLAREQAEGPKKGLDADGWLDTSSSMRPAPTPAQGPVLLEAAEELLRTRFANLSPDTYFGPEDGAELLRIARLLRWLRGCAGVDRERWGAAIGVVRRVLSACGEHSVAIKQTVSSQYRTTVHWGRAAGVCEPAEATAAAPEIEVPAVDASDADLVAWLQLAFARLNSLELATVLFARDERFVDRVVALDQQEPKHPDRGVRSRIRKLAAALSARRAPPPAARPPDAVEAPADSGPIAVQIDPRIRERTQGKRALLVSNREDHELGAQIANLFGFTVALEGGNVRKTQAACERVANASYDFVLCATGFALHSLDSALSKAAKKAQIPYVRIDRGRPLACAQALARELGIQGDDARAARAGGA